MAAIVPWLINCFFFFKQKTAYELRISDWSSDVCSSDLHIGEQANTDFRHGKARGVGHDPVAGPHHQADTAAHDDTAAPADDRLGIAMDCVVQAVFDLEEFLGIGVVPRLAAGVLEQDRKSVV